MSSVRSQPAKRTVHLGSRGSAARSFFLPSRLPIAVLLNRTPRPAWPGGARTGEWAPQGGYALPYGGEGVDGV